MLGINILDDTDGEGAREGVGVLVEEGIRYLVLLGLVFCAGFGVHIDVASFQSENGLPYELSRQWLERRCWPATPVRNLEGRLAPRRRVHHCVVGAFHAVL